ncbi:MAG: homocysteine S-methyltransferase family protein [Eubacteriales bacterium]|nr:homocysteine S-methyltransferase family protein [Eubacteriales bacterium]
MTRRTNRERAAASRFSSSLVKDNVDFLRRVQAENALEMYIGGMIGCKGDAYTGEGALSLEQAQAFHRWEINLFAKAGVDFLYAALIPSAEEAAGIARAAQETRIPYLISFTIRKDGCLIDGTPISEAIASINAITEYRPAGYMTNCVHPAIAYEALSQPCNSCEWVRSRFVGIQANTACLSYEELDHSKELKSSDPVELAEAMIKLREIVPLQIFGGCCGTDGRHMLEIAKRIGERGDQSPLIYKK